MVRLLGHHAIGSPGRCVDTVATTATTPSRSVLTKTGWPFVSSPGSVAPISGTSNLPRESSGVRPSDQITDMVATATPTATNTRPTITGRFTKSTMTHEASGSHAYVPLCVVRIRRLRAPSIEFPILEEDSWVSGSIGRSLSHEARTKRQ